jgi:hypothetical protein
MAAWNEIRKLVCDVKGVNGEARPICAVAAVAPAGPGLPLPRGRTMLKE